MGIAITSQRVQMTSAGYERLRLELDELRSGSVDALEEQTLLDHRIAILESRLADAEVVSPPDDGPAGIGTIVRLRTSSGEVRRYELVGAGEADGRVNTISVQSPVGSALQGCRTGDHIEVEAPRRVRRLEVLSVEPIRPTEDP
jgi:transcription elongation factor GreA